MIRKPLNCRCVEQVRIVLEKRLVAYVVAKRDQSYEPDALRTFLRAGLPDYMIPGAFVRIDEIPKTAHGKADRRALPAPPNERLSAVPYVKPSTETERLIAGIWRDVLELEKVGVNDNFFDLGGHSLSMSQVYNRLLEEVSADVTLVDLFKYPTVRELARFLVEGEADAPVLEMSQDRAEMQRAAIERQQRLARTRRPAA